MGAEAPARPRARRRVRRGPQRPVPRVDRAARRRARHLADRARAGPRRRRIPRPRDPLDRGGSRSGSGRGAPRRSLRSDRRRALRASRDSRAALEAARARRRLALRAARRLDARGRRAAARRLQDASERAAARRPRARPGRRSPRLPGRRRARPGRAPGRARADRVVPRRQALTRPGTPPRRNAIVPKNRAAPRPDVMTHRSSKCRSLGLALGGWLAFVSCARAEDAEGTPPAAPGQLEERLLEELAARGAKIGNIEIVVQNVFDTSDPEESKRLYRWANRMHMTTRESVIESILLFEEGDPLEPRLLAESARLLRARDFLVEATVEPSAYHEETNTVDILVVARDGWSLSPEIKIGRNGGENELGLGIEESNLLGTGKGLTVSYSTDVDRDEAFLAYADPNVRGSRAKLNVVLANTSDGDRFSLSAGRPSYALDTRWSVEGLVHDEERVDPIYDLGETVDEFVHLHRTFTIQGGWSRGIRGNDRALRWIGGFTRDEHEFRP